MSKIEAGTYKGRGIEGSVQHGTSKKGTEQVALDLNVPALGRSVTTFLYFSDDAMPYALERLRALGWEGGDDPKFPGIAKNEVDIQIRYEMFDGKEQMKVDIWTGGGRPVLKAPMSAQEQRGFMGRLSKVNAQETGTTGANPASGGQTAGGKIAL